MISTRQQLLIAVEQAQAELDRWRQRAERQQRYVQTCSPGVERRKADNLLDSILNRMRIAEQDVRRAASAYARYEEAQLRLTRSQPFSDADPPM